MPKIKMTKPRAIFYLIVSAVLWSSSGVLIKEVSWNPLAITSARGLLAGICLSLLLKEKLRFRSLSMYHGISGLSLVIMSACFICSMRFTTSANAIVLLFSAPIWVALIAPFFVKERTSALDWAFIAIIFAGIILFFLDRVTPTGFLGIILGIVSGFCFAMQVMTLRRISGSSPGSAMILGNFMAFVMFLPFWAPPWPRPMDLLVLFSMGVFQVGFSYYLYTLAIPFVSSLELLMIMMLEPVLTPIITFTVIGERPGRFALVGGLVVILSVCVWTWLQNRPPKAVDPYPIN